MRELLPFTVSPLRSRLFHPHLFSSVAVRSRVVCSALSGSSPPLPCCQSFARPRPYGSSTVMSRSRLPVSCFGHSSGSEIAAGVLAHVVRVVDGFQMTLNTAHGVFSSWAMFCVICRFSRACSSVCVMSVMEKLETAVVECDTLHGKKSAVFLNFGAELPFGVVGGVVGFSQNQSLAAFRTLQRRLIGADGVVGYQVAVLGKQGWKESVCNCGRRCTVPRATVPGGLSVSPVPASVPLWWFQIFCISVQCVVIFLPVRCLEGGFISSGSKGSSLSAFCTKCHNWVMYCPMR